MFPVAAASSRFDAMLIIFGRMIEFTEFGVQFKHNLFKKQIYRKNAQ